MRDDLYDECVTPFDVLKQRIAELESENRRLLREIVELTSEYDHLNSANISIRAARDYGESSY